MSAPQSRVSVSAAKKDIAHGLYLKGRSKVDKVDVELADLLKAVEGTGRTTGGADKMERARPRAIDPLSARWQPCGTGKIRRKTECSAYGADRKYTAPPAAGDCRIDRLQPPSARN
jgi:hypothetical protein